jgi:hypothetical protein
MVFIIDLPAAAAITGPAEAMMVAPTSITAYLGGLAMAGPADPVDPTDPAMAATTTSLATEAAITGRAETTTTTMGGITRPTSTPGWQSVPMCTACLRIACMKCMAA